MKIYLPTSESKTVYTGLPNLLFLLATALFLGTAACTQTTETDTENDTAIVEENDADNTDGRNENANLNEYENDNIAGETGREQVEWNNVDFNIMQDRYNEINDRDISVGSNQQVAVYSLNEPVLFDKQGNELRSGAEQKLQQIATSVNQRYPNAQIRIYGYGEQEGAATNAPDRDLAQKRATAVQNWLTSNGKISANRISVHTSGGTQPGMANNQTTPGTANTTANQDRKVSIVVYRGDNAGAATSTNSANTGAASNTNSGQQPASTSGKTTR